MKGKYAQRADSRLRVLESEALRESSAKIDALKTELAQTKHQLHTAQAEIQSKAMQAAAALSAREKKHLRDKLASVEQQVHDERMKLAILTWELMHRSKFGEPAPRREAFRPRCADEWYQYWLEVKFLLVAVFFPTYDEAEEFLDEIEGRWELAGFERHTKRENNRWVRKGTLRNFLARRHADIRQYWQAVYKARQGDSPVPVKAMADWRNNDDKDWQETRMKEIRVSRGTGPIVG
jgi:hypothetical protein